MKGDKKAIEYLNQILANELVAINQYFLHSKILEDWGYANMAKKAREESIDEMKHADALADRILFLEGMPNFQNLGKLLIGQTVQEMLECDLKLENKAIPDLKEAIQYVESIQDFGTRDMLTDILTSEEEHVDWIETQLELIKQIGLQNYLQSQV